MLRSLRSVRSASLLGLATVLALAIWGPTAIAHASNTLTVAPAGDTSCGVGTPYNTIQSAVTAAVAGDHIVVCPGTYPEHVVIDNSGHSRDNLQLTGTAILSTSIEFPSTAPTNPTDPDAIVLVNGPTGVTISNFTIRGPWNDANPLACAQPSHYGVFVEGGGSATISNNHIIQIQDADPLLAGCQDGLAVRIGSNFLMQTGSGTVTNNLFENYQKNGVTIDGPGTSAVVSNNRIIGDTFDTDGVNPIIARNGIQFGRSATGSITGNVILRNEYSGAMEDPDDNDATGILLFTLSKNVTVQGNQMTYNDIGLDISDASGVSMTGNSAYRNRFNGIRAEIDATGNSLVNNTTSGTPSGGFDCRDDSIGMGTAGTANTWTNDSGNSAQPAGICHP